MNYHTHQHANPLLHTIAACLRLLRQLRNKTL